MISAKVIADSVNPSGDRLTTMIVVMPRFILAEFNTHRMFSRNSASSRAIPFKKLVQTVKDNPFIPIAWQKDHPGMQGVEYITHAGHLHAIRLDWLHARDAAVRQATELSAGFKNDNGEFEDQVTKQLCNRLLEPFMYHTVIVTSSEWENFFHLRCPRYKHDNWGEGVRFLRSKDDWLTFNALNIHADQEWTENLTQLDWLKMNEGQAEIHMMATAEAMWDALKASKPTELKAGQWHIPFEENMDEAHAQQVAHDQHISLTEVLIHVSAASSARVSYTTVGEEGKPIDYAKDIKLHDRLAASGHWSPFEHIAQAEGRGARLNRAKSGNLGRGWVQYRKMFQGENVVTT